MIRWTYTGFVWPFALSVLVLGALVLYAWPRRDVRAAVPFIATTALAALWSLLSSLQMLAVGLPAKAVLSDLRFLAIATLPVAWFTFALVYTGQRHGLSLRLIGALLALPLLTLFFVATNAWHGLMFAETTLSTAGPIPSVARAYGPWFWTAAAYNYVLMIAGAALMVLHAFTVPRPYRGQAALAVAGAFIPLIVNALFLSDPGRFAHIDPTPVSFSVSGLFFAWGLFRFHLLDLMPVARAAIVESIPDAVVVLDARHRVIDLNPAAQRLFEQSPSSAVGLPIATISRELDIAWPEEIGTEGVNKELTLRIGGARRYFDCSMSPLQRRPGRVTERLVVVVLRDVTDQRRSALFEASQKRVLEMIARGLPLAEVLEALARFAEEVSSGDMLCSILLLDEDGRRLRHGAAPGLPADYTEAVDGSVIGPSAGSCGTAAFLGETVVVTDIAADARWDAYRHLALPHGLRACWATPIFSSEGTVLGTFALYYRRPGAPDPVDVRILETATHLAGIAIERRRFEAALIEAKDRAEEMARLKSAFLANMSHEIRTPLTSIIGFADILAGQLDAEHQELITHICKAGTRLLGTLNSVLDYARLEAGQVEMRTDVLSVSDVARETVASFLPQTRARGLSLRLDDRAPHACARLDRSLLIRVLNNLIDNALKFTDQGGVVLSVRASNAHVTLEVKDTGRGISKAFLPSVFDEFRQESTGMARSHQGSGLGLKITKRIVEQMQGTISVQSRKGEGSTFTVTFPRVPAHRTGTRITSSEASS